MDFTKQQMCEAAGEQQRASVGMDQAREPRCEERSHLLGESSGCWPREGCSALTRRIFSIAHSSQHSVRTLETQREEWRGAITHVH